MPVSEKSVVDRVYFVHSESKLLTAVLYRDPKGAWQLSERIQRFDRIQEKPPDEWVEVQTGKKSAVDLRTVRAQLSEQAADLAKKWDGHVEVLEVNGSGADYARLMAQRGHVDVISIPMNEGPMAPQ